jgi:hypothetical protein
MQAARIIEIMRVIDPPSPLMIALQLPHDTRADNLMTGFFCSGQEWVGSDRWIAQEIS